MRKLYVKLAAVNIRNNRQLYLPYLLAGVFSAAMFYLVMSIQDNPGLEQMSGGTRRRLLSGAYGGGRSLCHYHVFCGGAACDSGNVLSVYCGQYCRTQTASEK